MSTVTIRNVHYGRSWPRWALLGLELFVGVGAVYGAIMLVVNAWHLPVADLAPLPLHSWVLPGIALFAGVAVPMLTAAALLARRARWAAEVSIAAGVLLVGWIAVQLAVIGPQMFLQAVMATFGLAIAGLAGWWRGASGAS
jgi:hypothetical protein